MSVVNLKERVDGERPKYDIYCGRPWQEFPGSVWANPYSTFKMSEEEALRKYEEYFWNTSILVENVKMLKGKTLACWCKPKPCHAEFLCALANKEDGEDEEESVVDETESDQESVPRANKRRRDSDCDPAQVLHEKNRCEDIVDNKQGHAFTSREEKAAARAIRSASKKKSWRK